MYSICDLNFSYSSTIMPRIFFNLFLSLSYILWFWFWGFFYCFIFKKNDLCFFLSVYVIFCFLDHCIIVSRSHWSSFSSCFKLLLLCHKLYSSAYLDSFGGCLERQLGSCKFDFEGSAEKSSVKTRNSTGLSMDPWWSLTLFSNHSLT